jgi:hypothetical protein
MMVLGELPGYAERLRYSINVGEVIGEKAVMGRARRLV